MRGRTTWLFLFLLLCARARAVCHQTPHHNSSEPCEACVSAAGCDHGAACWPDGWCRVGPPFHVHMRQGEGPSTGGRLTFVEGGGPVELDVVAADPAAVRRVSVLALTLCACNAPHHSNRHEAAMQPLDTRTIERTGCQTPGAGLRVHQYTFSRDNSTGRGGFFAPDVLAPPSNPYAAEMTVQYTAVAPSPYLSGEHAAGSVVTGRFVQALDGLEIRVVCGAEQTFDAHLGACVSRRAILMSVWFSMYCLGCVMITALLISVCRLRSRSIAIRRAQQAR